MIGTPGDWGGGYVTDLAYLPGYYRQQSPLHLNLACLLNRIAGIPIGPDTAICYLELACGQGFGALMLAACNPQWQVIGIDFNPAHIASARSLAEQAGIMNAHFIEADLADFAESATARDIPPAHIVTSHGLWSWVGDGVRAGIVRLLDRKLKPGGIAHLSYNALPAWQGAIGMQRLLREAGQRSGASSDHQIAVGWELVQALADAQAHHLCDSGMVQALREQARRAPVAYLAHEYLNASWRPCFHADVLRSLAAAKLDWIGSAQLLENVTSLMLGDEARAVAARFDDPIMRELIKDMCLTRSLRHDVFVRGARRLSPAERDAALGEVTLALLRPAARFEWRTELPAGSAEMDRGFFGPIVAALADAPLSARELLALPGLTRRDNPAEIFAMLVGTQQAMPVLGPGREPDARVRGLNRAAADRFTDPDSLDLSVALAASGIGTPIPATLLDLFIVNRLQTDPTPDAAAWVGSLGYDRDESEQQRLLSFMENVIDERVPIWRQLGVLPRSPASI